MENGQAAPAPEAVTPQNVDNAIGAFADRLMGQMDAEDGRTPEPQANEQPPGAPEQEQEQSPEAEAQPEEEFEAIELDDQQYQVPKPLAEKLKELKNSGLRQDDYTRKTQEVAESRKRLEQLTAEAAKFAEQAKQLAPAYAQLQTMANRAQAIRQALTPELRANDPIEFNTLQSEYAILVNDLNIAQGQVGQYQAQLNQQQEQIRQQMMAERLPALFKEVPELAKEDVRNSLGQYARNQGLPESAIAEISYMPEAVKLLYKAQKYDEMMSKQAQATQSLKAKTQALPPVKKGAPAAQDAKTQATKAWKKAGGRFTDIPDSLLPKLY